MSVPVPPWKRNLVVFHLRLGCCGGCGDVVDSMIRDRYRDRPRVVECSSPRHAALLIVSGSCDEGLEGPALEVISQAPEGTPVLAVGDCPLARGPFAGKLAGAVSLGDLLEAGGEVAGCPPSLDAIGEGVRRVTR